LNNQYNNLHYSREAYLNMNKPNVTQNLDNSQFQANYNQKISPTFNSNLMMNNNFDRNNTMNNSLYYNRKFFNNSLIIF
jgi:hypothetical protein